MARILISLLLLNLAPSLFHKGPPVPICRRERQSLLPREVPHAAGHVSALSSLRNDLFPWVCSRTAFPKPSVRRTQASSACLPAVLGEGFDCARARLAGSPLRALLLSGRCSAYQQQSLHVARPVPGAGRDAGWLDSWNTLLADKLRSAAQPPGSSKETVQPCQGKSQ